MRRVCSSLLFVCLLAAFIEVGCGYRLASHDPTVLSKLSNSTTAETNNGELPTMKIKGINNPTLYVSLEHQLRAAFRDTIANRNIARWADFGLADYELQINIVSYSMEGWGYSRSGESVMYRAALIMEAIIYSGETNQEVWRSGPVSLSRTYDTDSEEEAAYSLALEVVERIVDRMRTVF